MNRRDLFRAALAGAVGSCLRWLPMPKMPASPFLVPDVPLGNPTCGTFVDWTECQTVIHPAAAARLNFDGFLFEDPLLRHRDTDGYPILTTGGSDGFSIRYIDGKRSRASRWFR